MNYMQNLNQLHGKHHIIPYRLLEARMNRHIIAPLLLCCLATFARADDLQLQDNPPDRYTVVKGDTLWGISGKFLKNPWRWPQVWKMNKDQIKNPNLIYPGDVVVLDRSGPTPELRLLRETVTLDPNVRVEPLSQAAIPAIPPRIIDPFLSQPLVIDGDGLENAPALIASEEGHVVLGKGFKVYADKIEEGDGLNWQIFRPGQPLIDPDSKEVLGVEAVYLGEVRVIRYGDPATVEIKKASVDIYPGDRLVKAPEVQLTTFIPHAPDEQVQGRIIAAYNGIDEIGPNSIVTLNLGSMNGLEPGHVLAIHELGATLPPKKKADTANSEGDPETQGTKLPDERIGLLMVFRTFDRVSYALVIQAQRSVHQLDVVSTP
jgi:hypothetical protein